MPQLTCSSCGAPIQIENQFVRAITCPFCGASYLVEGDSTLNPSGKGASLANYPSRLSVGTRGKIRGREFTVLGRIRYTYDEGFWDEWQIAWDDGTPPDWLEEDEGYWTVFKKERVRSAVVPLSRFGSARLSRLTTAMCLSRRNVRLGCLAAKDNLHPFCRSRDSLAMLRAQPITRR